jgi:hypothetical protein
MNNIEQQILDLINHDYSHTTFDTRLYELFCKEDKFVKAYIKVGRKFWHYDGEKMKWRKLTVTYTRSNVMFFTFDDEPDAEYAWFMGSMNVLSLHAAEIYPYEISEILSEMYPDNDFAEVCKQCKWDDCDGEITVEIIWE